MAARLDSNVIWRRNMGVSDGVFLIAGYVLAHGAYSVSDLDADELLIPFAVTQSGESQEVIRFEAETQEEAIENGKMELEKLRDTVDIYGFAREGSMRTSDGKDIDVISVEAWEKGLTHKVVIIQPFKANNGSGEFKILPGMMIAIDGETIDGEKEDEFVDLVRRGIAYHPAGDNWTQWEQ
jgi:hypothetical protein